VLLRARPWRPGDALLPSRWTGVDMIDEKITNKADAIRAHYRDGVAVADIARRLGTRYQHARQVLVRSGLLQAKATTGAPRPKPAPAKPPLTVEILLKAGFEHLGCWRLKDGQLALDRPAPVERGVYVFAQDNLAVYVGVSARSLSHRLGFYIKPGKTQTTSLRLNAALRDELAAEKPIQVYIATPPDIMWNGLPVCGAAGLELGLIRTFNLPWNKRGAR
jgi:transposase-like protein